MFNLQTLALTYVGREIYPVVAKQDKIIVYAAVWTSPVLDFANILS